MHLAMWFFTGAVLGWTILENGRRAWPYLSKGTGFGVPDKAAFLLVFLLPAALLVVSVAVATDNASLSPSFLVLRSFFLGSRFEATFVGVILGALASRRRRFLARAVTQLSASILGDTGNTAWAFQSAIALLLIAVVVFAIRPDFLDYPKVT
jgi:hypothetical protein